MSEIKDLSQASFFLVRRDHFGLQFDALRDQPLDDIRFALQNRMSLSLEALKQLRTSDDSGLYNLIEPGAKFAIRQSREHIRINQDCPRLVKGAHQVLPCLEIDSGFSADRCVDLCEDCGRHLYHLHAAHIQGCEQSRDITYDASALPGVTVPFPMIHSRTTQESGGKSVGCR